MKTLPLLAALILGASGAAFPQDRPLVAAWDAALALREPVLSDAEFARVQAIGHQAAVAGLCDGFELDPAKVAAAGDAILAEGADRLEEAELMARQADILLTLGRAQGLFLAEGALDRDRFCADAAEARADPAFANYWR